MDMIRLVVLVTVIWGSLMGVQNSTPAAGSPESPDRIELPGEAGEALFWQGGPRAVLLSHGARFDAASWTEQAEAINQAGYSVLSVESISRKSLETAISWLLTNRDATGVVVIGASAGGSAALAVLADQPTGIVGLVTLGSTGDTADLGDYPKLFTASEGEGMQGRLQTMAEDAPGDANRVEIIPGSAHAQNTFDHPEGELLMKLILEFLKDDAVWPVVIGTPVASPVE